MNIWYRSALLSGLCDYHVLDTVVLLPGLVPLLRFIRVRFAAEAHRAAFAFGNSDPGAMLWNNSLLSKMSLIEWSSPGNFGQSIPLHCATPLMHLQDAHDAENHSSPSSWIFPSLLHSFVYKISNHLEGFLFPNKLLPSAAHPHRKSNHRSIFLAIQFLCSRFLASDHRDKSLGDIRRLGIGS